MKNTKPWWVAGIISLAGVLLVFVDLINGGFSLKENLFPSKKDSGAKIHQDSSLNNHPSSESQKNVANKPDANALPKFKCEAYNADSLLFELKGCRRKGTLLECKVRVTNKLQRNVSFQYFCREAIAISDQGREYRGYRSKFGTDESFTLIGASANYTSISNTYIDGMVEFMVGEDDIKSLQIFELKDLGLQCRNVPIDK